MPVTLRPIKLKGAKEYSDAIARANLKDNPTTARRALRRIAEVTRKTARDRYLSGPAPHRLERRTGQLGSSITIDGSRLPHSIEIGVHQDLFWAENYELGRGPRGKRPFMQPTVRDVLPEAQAIVLDEWRRAVE